MIDPDVMADALEVARERRWLKAREGARCEDCEHFCPGLSTAREEARLAAMLATYYDLRQDVRRKREDVDAEVRAFFRDSMAACGCCDAPYHWRGRYRYDFPQPAHGWDDASQCDDFAPVDDGRAA